jgi:hypothetical protein
MAITGKADLSLSIKGTVIDTSLSGAGTKRTGQTQFTDLVQSWAAAAGKTVSQITGTLAAATPVDIDLDGASIKDLNGDAVTFDVIDLAIIKNTGLTNAIDKISGDFLGFTTTNPDYIEPSTADYAGIRVFGFGAGRSVVATTNDVITLESTTGTTYSIVLVGDKD